MKRTLGIIGALVAVVLVGTLAWAHGPGHEWMGKEMMRRHVSAKIDGALQVANASQAQKDAIHQIRDRAFTQLEAIHEQHRGEHHFGEALALFEQPTLDDKVIAAKRDEALAGMRAAGDVIVGSLKEAHDDLTAPQRQAIVAHLRAEKMEHDEMGGFMKGRMKAMVDERINAALDAIKATPAQRALVAKVHDNIHAAVMAGMESRKTLGDKALALWAGDWNDAAVQQLRAEAEQAHARVADAIVDGVKQVHAALTPEQRKALVEYVKAQHGKHFGMGHFGPHEE